MQVPLRAWYLSILRLEVDLAEGLQPWVIRFDLDLAALRPRLLAELVINPKSRAESLSIFELPSVVGAFSRPLSSMGFLLIESKLLAGHAEVSLSERILTLLSPADLSWRDVQDHSIA